MIERQRLPKPGRRPAPPRPGLLSPATAEPGATAPGADGTPLHLRHWPPVGAPWATVLVVHGIGEHSGRYERTGRLLAEAGLDVHAFDIRGHGLSGGRRVYVRRWDDYLDDLEGRLAAVRQPGRPLVLFGHSMGALIALTYACSDRPAPDLLVLSAPPLEASVPGWQRAVAPVLSRVAPTFALANPIAGEQLSRDPAVGTAYFADPLVQPRSTTRLGAELFKAMKRGRTHLDRLHTPTLVIHGGDDTLVPTRDERAAGGNPRGGAARPAGPAPRDSERAGGAPGGRRHRRMAAFQGARGAAVRSEAGDAMSVEIGTCPPDRFAELLRTAEVAFGEDVSDELIERVTKVSDPARFVCAVDGDRFVGTGGVFSVKLSVPGGELPAGGVTWVTVLPSHRRRGILRGMMRLMIDDCHARNEPLAMLWASEGAIYQRFGYGLATVGVHLEAETTAARFAREWPVEGSCRLLRAGEGLDLVTPVYEAARAQRAGFLSRTPDWWVGQLPLADKDAKGGAARRLVVYETDQGPEAYAVYKTKADWGRARPQRHGERRRGDRVDRARDARDLAVPLQRGSDAEARGVAPAAGPSAAAARGRAAAARAWASATGCGFGSWT